MILKEIKDERKLEDDEIYTTAIACEIEPKLASTVLELFSALLPLQQYGLGHLKRMRKTVLQKSSDKQKDIILLEILLCPEKNFDQVPTDLLKYIQKQQIVRVAKIPACNRIEFEEWGRIWPSSYRPNIIERERENGTSEKDMERIKRYMEIVKNDGNRLEIVLKKPNDGGIIVNPVNEEVVMTSTTAFEHLMKIEGDAACMHPLYTTTMICIEGISAIVRGEIDCKGILPDDYYLCTGLDIYLNTEPDLMSAMALVHSRIRHVYYLNESLNDGALNTFYKLHCLRSLNHKFRVFHLVEDTSRNNNR